MPGKFLLVVPSFNLLLGPIAPAQSHSREYPRQFFRRMNLQCSA